MQPDEAFRSPALAPLSNRTLTAYALRWVLVAGALVKLRLHWQQHTQFVLDLMDNLLQDAADLQADVAGPEETFPRLQTLLDTYAILVTAIGSSFSGQHAVVETCELRFRRFLTCLGYVLDSVRVPTWRLQLVFDGIATVNKELGSRSALHAPAIVTMLMSQFRAGASSSFCEWWLQQLQRAIVGLGEQLPVEIVTTLLSPGSGFPAMRSSSNPRVVAGALRICRLFLRQKRVEVVQQSLDFIVAELQEIALGASGHSNRQTSISLATFNLLVLQALTNAANEESRLRLRLLRPSMVEFVTGEQMDRLSADSIPISTAVLRFLRTFYTGHAKVGCKRTCGASLAFVLYCDQQGLCIRRR